MMISEAIVPVIGLLGVVIGAVTQYVATQAAQNRRALMESRTSAYLDYLKALVDLEGVRHQPRPADSGAVDRVTQTATDAAGRLVNARMRIAVYGSVTTARAAARFATHQDKIGTHQGKIALLQMVAAMRKDTPGQGGRIPDAQVLVLLFGKLS